MTNRFSNGALQMQNNMNSMAPVSSLAVEDRAQFIWKCYAHVVGAILALIAVEYYLFSSGVAGAIAGTMMQSPTKVRHTDQKPSGLRALRLSKYCSGTGINC